MSEPKVFFHINVSQYDKAKDFEVFRPASLDKPHDNAVMFVNTQNLHKLNVLDTVKDCIIFIPTGKSASQKAVSNNLIIESDDPRMSYCLFFRENGIKYLPPKEKYISKDGALIAENAIIGKDTVIMPFACIGGEVKVGDNCYIGSGSKLMGNITIGDNVVIRENTVIGANGLSTDRDAEGKAATMPQFGGVIIEDDVEIGANCVIARGAIDFTTIKRGSKIDNSSFISHNVTVGEDTFVVGETIMFGGSSTGKGVFISGNTTVRNKTRIGDGAFVGMGALVTKDVPEGTVVYGNPAHGKDEK